MSAAFSSSAFSIQAFSVEAFAFDVVAQIQQVPPYALEAPQRRLRAKENDEALIISTLL